jgi:hypothetical protein
MARVEPPAELSTFSQRHDGYRFAVAGRGRIALEFLSVRQCYRKESVR